MQLIRRDESYLLTGVLFALKELGSQRLRVIDFAGCAAHYLLAKEALGQSIELNWSVIELAPHFSDRSVPESSELSFHGNLSEAIQHSAEPDLIVVSGGLFQLGEGPAQRLKSLFACKARYMLFLRAWTTSGLVERIFIEGSRHSSGETFYPKVLMPRAEFDFLMSEAGYTKLLHFEERLSFECRQASGFGALYRLQ